MKSAIFFIMIALSSVAHAEAWKCSGKHSLKEVSFEMGSMVKKFKVVAPDLDQKGLQEAFVQVNTFTLAASSIIDVRAQETMDYTLIIDRSAKTLTVNSQWSTNENVDSETINCSVK